MKKTYKVHLYRTLSVKVEANSESNAKQFAEYFIASGQDVSDKKDMSDYNFKINDIELLENNAVISEIDNEKIKNIII